MNPKRLGVIAMRRILKYLMVVRYSAVDVLASAIITSMWLDSSYLTAFITIIAYSIFRIKVLGPLVKKHLNVTDKDPDKMNDIIFIQEQNSK